MASLDLERVHTCLEVLEQLVADPSLLAPLDHDTRQRLLIAAGRVSRPERQDQRALTRAVHKKRAQEQRLERREAEDELLERSLIRKLRRLAFAPTPPPGLGAPMLPEEREEGDALALPSVAATATADSSGPELLKPRACYVCKTQYSKLHFFYDQLCPSCGDRNFAKRSQKADLSGRTAIITGARVKIGYQAAILLLRSGARTIVTTRFPVDAARRFAEEADFDDWKDRLQVYGLDLRHTPSVEGFARHMLHTENRLDFVIHNACQTVRRPPGFYAHLMDTERNHRDALDPRALPLLGDFEKISQRHPEAALSSGGSGLPALAQLAPSLIPSAEASQLPFIPEDFNGGDHLFPAGQLDADQQQVDLRKINSWRLALDEVSTVELLEVQLVNAIAPFVLNARLRPLMCRTPSRDKHIVNVSAMEGQFYRRFKTDKHPHTNMAKAALNMMTRTSAPDYLKDGIHMNSVDTGWVTDEDPAHIAERKTRDTGFQPPLDIVDGAARIVDPILAGINSGEHLWGQFLKDYQPTHW